jgi:alginate O-acetyltransferase complex protein AlgI
MSLISVQYAAFVAITATLFYLTPLRARLSLLGAASIVFCALNSVSAAIALLLATVCAFYVARRIEQAIDERMRRVLLGVAIGLLLMHLVLIKILPHLNRDARGDWWLAAVGAFGASYYTLKLVGYLIDVFWRRYPAWRLAPEFATFATFFPLLPAGPIQRANEFIPETSDSRTADLMVQGLRRILLGLLKKVVVADQLGGIVDYIATGQPEHANLLWLMACLFPLQLYADFSALTDIGVGAAAIFGVRAPENFAFPFFAPSISEFWRRWHMSLTRWLGDYVFTPLRMATRSLGTAGLAISIVVNMTLIGMWHAISFGWLMFGLTNALFLIADAMTLRHRQRFYKLRPAVQRIAAIFGPVLVFNMIALSLIFFHAQTPAEIAYFFGNVAHGLRAPRSGLLSLFYSYGRGPCAYAFSGLCGFAILESWLYLRARGWRWLASFPRFDELPRAVRWSVYYLTLFVVGIASHQSSRFIYVQF